MSPARLAITAVEEAPESAPFVLRGPLADSIKTAADIGYGAIELHVADPTRLDIPSIRRELGNSRIRVSSIGTGLAYAKDGLSLSSPVAKVRRQAVDRILSHLHFARELSCPVIIGLIRGRISEGEGEQHYFARLEDSLGQCLATAEELGVSLLLESVNRAEADALTSAAETLAFIDKMGSKNLLLHLDTYHMDIAGEPWEETFALAGSRLGHVHLADRDRLPPGLGGIEFADVIHSLEAIRYQGFLALECRPFPSPIKAADQSLAYLQAVIARCLPTS